MANKSVVVNYEAHSIFPTGNADGYLQFTRSGDVVYITRDGHDVGMVKASEFEGLASLITPF